MTKTTTTARRRAINAEPQRLRNLPDEAVLDLVDNETDPLFKAMAEIEMDARTRPAGNGLANLIDEAYFA